MNKIRLFSIPLSCFLISACIGTHRHHTAELQLNPTEIKSREPAELTFQVRNPKGEKVSELEIVHEKPIHLFIVSDDLSQYFHEHPEKQTDGTYNLPFTFPNGGRFKIFLDFKPPDDEQTTESFDVVVAGEKLKEIALIPEERFEKTVDGLRVKMTPNTDLTKQKDIRLGFQAFDAETGNPAGDLQNYLGAKAHFVIIRKGLGRFVHAHPMPPGQSGDRNSNKAMPAMNHSNQSDPAAPLSNMTDTDSKVSAMVNFPNSGIYKIFAQFKRNDRIITVTFVFEVKG